MIRIICFGFGTFYLSFSKSNIVLVSPQFFRRYGIMFILEHTYFQCPKGTSNLFKQHYSRCQLPAAPQIVTRSERAVLPLCRNFYTHHAIPHKHTPRNNDAPLDWFLFSFSSVRPRTRYVCFSVLLFRSLFYICIKCVRH